MASTIKQRLRRYNSTDYDTIHLETQAPQVLVQDSVLQTLLHLYSISQNTTPTKVPFPEQRYNGDLGELGAFPGQYL